MSRVRRAIMGDNFSAWADVYFAQTEEEANENLDHLLIKQSVYKDWYDEVGHDLKIKSVQSFKTKLKVWCRDKGYEFCPPEIPDCQADGRIVKKILLGAKRTSMELIYIRTSKDKPLNLELPSSWYS